MQVISKTKYAPDFNSLYFTGGGNGPLYGIRWQRNENHSLLYLQGLLDSKLLYFSHIAVQRRGGYYEYLTEYVEQLPIRTIDFDDPADAARHERMVALVQRMLDLHKRLAAASLPQDKELLQRQIDATDRQIDALVYELYGLTGDEIAIVEDSAA